MFDYRQNITFISICKLGFCLIVFSCNLCQYQRHTNIDSSFPIQFISMQMGACLESIPGITWMFVWSITVQMLLLFHLVFCCQSVFQILLFPQNSFFFRLSFINKCYGSASLTMFLTQTSLELLSSEASVIHSRNRTCTT